MYTIIIIGLIFDILMGADRDYGSNAPKIILKTTESKDLSVGNWNPFKVITTKSTKISKVILPKDQFGNKNTIKINQTNVTSYK